MRPGLVLAALGGTINIAGATSLVKHGHHVPASWCVTYLSTYLAPVSTGPAVPGSSDTSTGRIGSSLVPSVSGTSSSGSPPSAVPSGASSAEEQQPPDSSVTSVPLPSISSGTLLPTDVVSSDLASTATASPNPGGRNIIFQVVPSTDPGKRGLSKRALGGYVGSAGAVNPDVCTDAAAFSLSSGQLLDNDIPIYYDGEEFKLFDGQGPPPDGAITTTFQNVGGSLRWVNPSLPNGQAGFCQDAASGQVYITFSGQPEDCRPVTISVFTVEQCLNGELDARVPSDSTSATTANLTVISSSGVGTSQVAASTDVVDSTESSGVPATLPGDSASSKASPASTDSLTATTVPEDASSSIVRTQSTDDSPSAETSTDRNLASSSRDDLSPTDAPATTSSLSKPVSFDSSATDSSDTDPSTSDLPSTDSSSTFIKSPSSTKPSSSLASTDLSLDSSTYPSFSATSSEASSIPDDTTSSTPMTTEPSTTEPLDSTSSETTVSTEPASSSSDSDTTTSADTTTSVDTTSSEPTTTTSAEAEPTVLFAADDFLGHQGQSRTISSDFSIYMYDAFSPFLGISVNGVIQLGAGPIDGESPHTSLPAEPLYGNVVLPYWTENRITPFSGQGITYVTLGTAPDRTLVIDFKVMPDAASGDGAPEPDHYSVTFFENRQRYCVVDYFKTNGRGSDATIGNQQYNTGPANQFSFNAGNSVFDNTQVGMTLEANGQFRPNFG